MLLKFSSSFSRLRFQIKPLLCVNLSTSNNKCVSDIVKAELDWQPIFKFPAIKWVAAFNRLKLYQLGLTGLWVPVSFALESKSLAIPELGLISLIVGVTGCLTLGFCSYFSKNVIGFIYMNKEGEKLKLAYVDYWGRRKHVEVPVESVLPLEEPRLSKFYKFDFYQKLKVADSKDSYKMTQKYGEVADPERFSSVFGE